MWPKMSPKCGPIVSNHGAGYNYSLFSAPWRDAFGVQSFSNTRYIHSSLWDWMKFLLIGISFRSVAFDPMTLLAISEVLDHRLISLSLLFERVSDTRTESSASKLFARAFNLLPRHAKFINSCSLYLKVAQLGEALNLHIPSKTNFTLAGPHGAILRTTASEHESMITKVNVLISQAYHVQSVSAMIRSAAVVWRITRWQWLLCSTLLTLRTSGVKWKFRSQTATCVIRK